MPAIVPLGSASLCDAKSSKQLMNHIKSGVVFAVFFGFAACSGLEAAITVDGTLGDWGITLNSQKHLVYNSAYGYSYDSQSNIEKSGQATVGGCKIFYDIEDSNDNSNSYRVGPLYGGQNYDAEALLVTVSGSNLYLAIATGQRPDNGCKLFGPGDISISTGTKTYGIEVGGNGIAGSQIVEGINGSTYKLDSSGNTLLVTQLPNQQAGSIWDGGKWTLGINGSGDVKTQLNTGGSNGGTYLGTSDYVYRFDSTFGQHAFIELCIPNYQELFGNDLQNAVIRWAPVCGNDQLSLSVIVPGEQSPTVPEPGSVLIWAGLTLAAAAWLARK
jgi:hypothetical protein